MISHGAIWVGLVWVRARGNVVRLFAATVGVSAVCAVAFAGSAAAFPTGCSQSGTTVTCTYTSGGETAFVVPAGVSSVNATVVGAQGGNDFLSDGAGGLGAQASGTIPVTSGETLYLEVDMLGGRSGKDDTGFVLAGNGGGESDVRTCPITGTCASGTTLGSRVLVAGGGGGIGTVGGAGGNAGTTGAAGNGAPASVGRLNASGGTGATTGGPGTGGIHIDSAGDGASGDSDGGAGGAGGDTLTDNGVAGGGGGAGWFGGGGGGAGSLDNETAGGGGGGSSNAAPSVTGATFSQATGGETPSVTLTFSAPDLTTTPNPTTATLGTVPPTLTDSAVVSGGNSPTGTITFTLIAPGGATVDTESAVVNGNGTYTTPTGFSHPGEAAGTYQWDASYSGDSNNPEVDDNNDSGEQVVVSAANPTLATTPNPASATLGAGATLKDSAVLSGGSAPGGTITFTLVAPSGTTVDTEPVPVSGNGTYTTPNGLSLVGAAAGMYQWDATYSGDSNNNMAADDNDPAEQVTVTPANPTLTTTPSPASATVGTPTTLKDSATLSGGSAPGGTITFTLFFNGGATPVDTETRSVSGNGTYTTPAGYFLPLAGSAGTYQWDATYSGDSNNTLVSDNNDPAEQAVVSAAIPALSGSPSAAAVTLGNATTTLTDSAVLSGGVAPTGTITFSLSLPRVGAPVDTETVPVTGNGTYTTPTGYNVPKTAAAVGTYQWNVSYTGDADNAPQSDANDPGEQVVVSAGAPAASVTSPASGAIYLVGQSVSSNFICSEGVGGPGISTCVNQSNQASGQSVDTSAPGAHTFTITATSGDGQTAHSTVSYIVAAGPSASISSPASGGVYTVGQSVATTFACADGAQGPGITLCTDSNGAGGGTGHLDTSTPGSHTYTVTATSGDGATGRESVSYTVAVGPSATITSPRNGASYSLGQKVPAGFTCTEGPSGPGISACAGNASNGSDIDTSTLGKHTFTVTATSADGQSSARSVTYTVLPNNNDVPKFKALANGTFVVTVAVPGPGRIDVLVTAWNNNLATAATLLNPAPHRFVYARAYGSATRARTLKITVRPNARGRRLVAHHTYPVTLRVWISYTPRGGHQRNIGYYNVHLP